jgi:hypothetical protein
MRSRHEMKSHKPRESKPQRNPTPATTRLVTEPIICSFYYRRTRLSASSIHQHRHNLFPYDPFSAFLLVTFQDVSKPIKI